MNKKKLIFSTVAVLSLGISSAVFFNGTFDSIAPRESRPFDETSDSELCDKIYEVASAQLSHQQIINHASNRFGYGISPLETWLHPNNANAETARQIICNLADELSYGANRPLFNSDILAFVKKNFNFEAVNIKTGSTYKYNPIVEEYGTLSKKFSFLEWVRYNYNKEHDVSKKNLDDALTNARYSSIHARLAVHAFASQTIDVESGLVRDKQVNLSSLLGEFWFNHFNVSLDKTGYSGGDISLLSNGGYERTIYEKQFGTFHELLKSVIYHPTMLHYLDNTENKYDTVNKQASNQNLGRELLELHTFGQGPGNVYDQADVEMAALFLSGLGGSGVRKDSKNYLTSPNSEICAMKGRLSLSINSRIDCSKKSIPDPSLFSSRLNTFLRFLSSHEVTKQNICTKLVSRFVHSLKFRGPVIESCKQAWGEFGDLPSIYKSIVIHPNTWSLLNYRNRFKNPLELVISSVRASGLSVNQMLNNKGDGLYLKSYNNLITKLGLKYRFWTTPDGYKENPDRISQGYLIRWAKGNLDIVNSRKNDSFKSLSSKNLLETIFGNLKPWIPDENSRLLFEQKSLESQAHAIFLQRSALQMSISDHKFLMK
jgi:hypothetical protein